MITPLIREVLSARAESDDVPIQAIWMAESEPLRLRVVPWDGWPDYIQEREGGCR